MIILYYTELEFYLSAPHLGTTYEVDSIISHILGDVAIPGNVVPLRKELD